MDVELSLRRSDGIESEYCTLTSTAVARSRKGKFEAVSTSIYKGKITICIVVLFVIAKTKIVTEDVAVAPP
jgi:hypothetical protein